MCGIAGIYCHTLGYNFKIVQKMTKALAHRGPDGEGYIAVLPGDKLSGGPVRNIDPCEGRVFFGHRRLKVIDLEGSAQPLKNEDGSVWVTYNGEIYNFKSLRDKLKSKGHVFRDQGDTEVLVHLWEEYGREMVKHLEGMFAFALYDAKQDIFFMARDRFGQKPLYFYRHPSFLAFASEIQSFWHIPDFPHDDLCQLSVAQYFRYGYIPSPGTIYKNVFSLLPGHTFILSREKEEIQCYWKPQVQGGKKAPSLEELSEKFDEALNKRLISDVPLGAFLSGGIDSSLIASSMVKTQGESAKAFTISFQGQKCDESAHASKVAQHLNMDHSLIEVKPNFTEVAEILAAHYGQPFADYSSVPTYYVCQETSKDVTVALSGDGGDELFAGYDRYANQGFYDRISQFPESRKQKLVELLSRPLLYKCFHRFFHPILSAANLPMRGENASTLFYAYLRRQFYTPEFLKNVSLSRDLEVSKFTHYFHEAHSSDLTERWLEADQRMYLCDDILRKVDTSSMAVSLECRAPFLDHHFAEWVNQTPLSWKIKGKKKKLALRQLNESRLGPIVSRLPKKGFTMPLGQWFRKEIRTWAKEWIFGEPRHWEPFIQKRAVDTMWKEHQNKITDHSLRLWTILSFNLWAESHKNIEEL